MTDIDDAIDDVRDAATDFLNSEGRSAGHVAIGVALLWPEHAASVGFDEVQRRVHVGEAALPARSGSHVT